MALSSNRKSLMYFRSLTRVQMVRYKTIESKFTQVTPQSFEISPVILILQIEFVILKGYVYDHFTPAVCLGVPRDGILSGILVL